MAAGRSSSASFDAFLQLSGERGLPPPSDLSGHDRTSPGLRAPPEAPYFYGRPEHALTELERLQCNRYRQDLEQYNLEVKQIESNRAQEIAAKDAEIAALERELRLQSEEAKNSKQVVIYTRPDWDRAYLNEQTFKIQEILARRGISEIVISDATKHPDLQELHEQGGTFPVPLVVIRGSPVGDFKDLQRLDEAGKLDALLDGSLRMSDVFIQNPDAPELQLGAIGSVLHAGERLVSGVGSLLYLPVALVSWPFAASEQPPPQPEGEEFTVVNTNWYGRQLHRIFRFTDKNIERVHPDTREVRASVPYTDVVEVECPDETNLIIKYREGTTPADYIRCPAKDIDRILHLLVLHCGGSLSIRRPD